MTATQYGTWIGYGGTARSVLAVVLLAAAGGVTYLGVRLPAPIRTARAGRTALIVVLVAWVVSILAFFAGASVYVRQMIREQLAQAPPADPITPVTVICVGAVFVVILIAGTHGWKIRLTSAVIGALAAPMIFEFPFDLIVMARTYPPVPPDPVLYRAVFFVPLFLIEITTMALLTFSPMVRLSTTTCYAFASLLVVFAVWGWSGFGYPSSPIPLALNVLSKILAFVVALSLFLPQRSRSGRIPRGVVP